jgi:hypothetical protein
VLAIGAGVLALVARAARTALAFQREAGELADGHPDWPRFRAVNLAARLEAAAPTGGVVVGAETAAALPSGALLERLPPVQVKGKEEPVEAYLLRGL